MTLTIKPINPAAHDAFMLGTPKEHYAQTPVWGEIKATDGWQREIIGFFDGQTLRASALLLRKRIPVFGKYLYYCPRGPVLDYTDRPLIAACTAALREYLKTHRAAYLTVDPDVAIAALDKYDQPVMPRGDLVGYFVRLGWRHGGYNMNFENHQPRFTFRLSLKDGRTAVYDNLDRMAKKNLKMADEAGIRVYKEDDLDKYFEIMRDTAKRDDFYEGAQSYYRRLYPILKAHGMAELWFARYEPAENLRLIESTMADVRKEITENEQKIAVKHSPKLVTKNEQLTQKLQRIEKQRATAQDYAEKYPQGLDLSTLITVQTQNRMWTLWGGNRSELRQMSANYKITWAAIEQACAQNLEFVDFYGSTGAPSPDNPITGIYAFKKKFSGLLTEFPGEFHLVTAPLVYFIWKVLSPPLLKLKRKLTRHQSSE